MDKNKKTKSGFSLVELMVVLAIVLIMTGIFLANQNGNKDQENVETAARQVAAQIRQLQNEALSGKQIGGVLVCGFRFDIVSGALVFSTSYYSYSDCAAGTGAAQIGASTQFNLNSKGLLGGTAKANSSNSFYFKAPRAGLSGGQVLINLVSKDGTKHASVCVCTSGNILEKGDDTACSGC